MPVIIGTQAQLNPQPPIVGPTPLVGPLPLNTVGTLGPPNWTVVQNTIATNASGAYGSVTGRNAVYWNSAVNAFTADQWVRATVAVPPPAGSTNVTVNILVRGSGSGTGLTYYVLGGTGVAISLAAVTSSTAATSIFSMPWSPAPGTTMAMDVNGTLLRAWVDGNLIYSGVPSVTFTSGQPGIHGAGPGSPPNLIDWAAGEGPFEPIPISVTTTSLPAGTVNIPWGPVQLTAFGGTPPYTFTVTGAPSWMQTPASGNLSGTPVGGGTTVTLTIVVRDSTNTPSTSVTLSFAVAGPVLTVTSTALPVATVGVPYQAALAATGGITPYHWTIAGTLGWLLIDQFGNVSGTPTAAGTTTFTATATDSAVPPISSAPTTVSVSAFAVQPAGVRVTTDFLIGTDRLGVPVSLGGPTALRSGQVVSIQLQATGGTPYATGSPYRWRVLSTLGGTTQPYYMPPGLSLNASTGVVSGTMGTAAGFQLNTTPQAGFFGVMQVVATDSLGVDSPVHRILLNPLQATAPASEPAVTITTMAPFPPYVMGTAYPPFQLHATGGTPYPSTDPNYPNGYRWTQNGLPTGITLSGDGLLSGTPTVVSSPSYASFITATDSLGVSSGQKQLAWGPIAPWGPYIASHQPTPRTAQVGVPYSGSFNVMRGTPPYTWSSAAHSSMPPGLTFDANGDITGTPTTAGFYKVTVGLTDSLGLASSTQSTIAFMTVLPAAGTVDWTRPTGVVLAQIVNTSVPAYCVQLPGGPDGTSGGGFTHPPAYDNLYAWGPLVANGNDFLFGWVATATGVNCVFQDSAKNFTTTDSRLVGWHSMGGQGYANYSHSLKWQMGTAPGRYRIWMGWAPYTLAGVWPIRRAFGASGSQFNIAIRDSNGFIGCVQSPTQSVGTGFTDAASNAYASAAAWTAAVDPAVGNNTYGGVSIVIDTADTSNGKGGPFIYFDCGNVQGNSQAAVSYVCAQYLGPSLSPVRVTSHVLPDQYAMVGVNATLQASGGTGTYTWTLVSGPAWLSVSSAGVVSGVPPATTVTSFVVTATSAGQVSAPHTIPLSIRKAPSVAPPQRVFPGSVTPLSVVGTCWPPADGSEPDSYNLYRDGVLVQTGIRLLNTGGYSSSGLSTPMLMFCDRDLPSGTTFNYDMTAVTAGMESQHSTPIQLTTTLATGVPVPPTPPADPYSWYTPFVYNAASGTTWLATVLTEPDSTFAGTPGTGTLNSQNCSLQYALAHCQPGDTIVCTAGAEYTSPTTSTTMYRPPVFPAGTTQVVNIISSEEPTYKSGGLLIPHAAPAKRQVLVPLEITALIAAGTTTATLAPNQSGVDESGNAIALTDASGNWLPRNRVLPTYFVGTDPTPLNFMTGHTPELSHVTYTHGSNTITWFSPFPREVGLATHEGNSGAPTIYPAWLIGVDPGDYPHMATLRLTFTPSGTGGTQTSTNTNGFLGSTYAQNSGGYVIAGMDCLRFVGINFVPAIGRLGAPGNDVGVLFITPQPGTAAQAATTYTLNNWWFDRCCFGLNSEDLQNFSHYSHYIAGAFRHFMVHQCHAWGANSWTGGDPFFFGSTTGDNQCLEYSYMEGASETAIWGGQYIAEAFLPTDINWRYNVSGKPTAWLRNQFGYAGTTGAGVPGQTMVGAYGDHVKNHFELKVGQRVHVHHNLNICCWGSPGGQNGVAFATGVRDQVASNTAAPAAFYDTCPWAIISDLDVHDNLSLHCGTFSGFFAGCSGDAQAASRCMRLRYVNNVHQFNPGAVASGSGSNYPGYASQAMFIKWQGAISDVTIEHNTLIVNNTVANGGTGVNIANSGNYFYGLWGVGSGDPWATLTGDPRAANWHIANNVMNPNNSAFNSENQGTGTTATGPIAFLGRTIANNMWPQTTAYVGATGTIVAPALTAWGMTYFVHQSIPPVPAAAWNITTGTYATAATDGTAIGATLT